MALPTTVVSAAGAPGHHPPLKIGSSFYTVVTASSTVVDVYKADGDDPADAWTVQDATNNPTGQTIDCLAAVDDGTIIHVFIVDLASDTLEHARFNTSSDTWTDTSWVQVDTFAGDTPDQAWCSAAVRSDGDVIVAYNSATVGNMGDEKERVDYARYESSSWTAGVALDAGGDNHYGNPNVGKQHDTDDMHIIWQKTEDTANDPPTGWQNQEGRTLDPSNNLSTVAEPNVAGSQDVLLGNPSPPMSFDDAGTDRVTQPGWRDLSSRIYWGNWTLDGSGDLVDDDGLQPTMSPDVGVFVANEHSVLTYALEPGTTNIHFLFADATDQDLYYGVEDDVTVPDIPTVVTEEIDAVTINFISGTIYDRGSSTVLAYLYDDAGTTKYNEKVLVAGNDMTATSTMLFQDTTDLVGVGELSDTSTLVFGETAVIDEGSVSDMTSTSTMLFGATTIDLDALGELAASGTLVFAEVPDINAAGELTVTATLTFGELTVFLNAELRLEQEGYRWRDDDGTETTANWLQLQEVDISRDRNITTRLRVLVDTIGEAPTQQFKLQYRKVGDPTWRDVPVSFP